ncbi:GntR family transcriptional regulator [Nonomuraea sp. NPDC051941]|uniref:GntR family transcriptional regulator n=1 Tax=Nonomuraea sp. NPDC051941 TaxID=3364373 RepID=UPI0037CA3905
MTAIADTSVPTRAGAAGVHGRIPRFRLEVGGMADGYKYEDIAAALIARIESGEYAPGDRLPSESELRREFDDANPATVRSALRVLHDAGLTRTERARGVYVRTYDRVAVDVAAGGGTSGNPIHQVEVTTLQTPRHIGELMEGEGPVIRRTSTRAPLVKSYYPRGLVDVVPELGEPHELAETDDELMKRAGLKVMSKTAQVIARMPTRNEAAALGLIPGTPVLHVITALTDTTTGTAVAVREAVYPGDQAKLRLDLA